jgi:CheY-like chemotaxis protein
VKAILIVDDELGNAEALALLLEDEGYRVSCSYNGREGLVSVAANPPDLVVLDFMMPVMNGGDMAKALRADPATRHIRIVMSSSLSEAGVREYFSDFDAFLRKPFSIDAVLHLVRNLLGE